MLMSLEPDMNRSKVLLWIMELRLSGVKDIKWEEYSPMYNTAMQSVLQIYYKFIIGINL